jgi:hypothetical protein
MALMTKLLAAKVMTLLWLIGAMALSVMAMLNPTIPTMAVLGVYMVLGGIVTGLCDRITTRR